MDDVVFVESAPTCRSTTEHYAAVAARFAVIRCKRESPPVGGAGFADGYKFKEEVAHLTKRPQREPHTMQQVQSKGEMASAFRRFAQLSFCSGPPVNCHRLLPLRKRRKSFSFAIRLITCSRCAILSSCRYKDILRNPVWKERTAQIESTKSQARHRHLHCGMNKWFGPSKEF